MSAHTTSTSDELVPSPDQRRASTSLPKRALDYSRRYGIVIVTVALFLVLSVSSDPFLSVANLRNILDQQSTVLIVASAATLIMIAGGFDVSLSAVYVAGPLIAFRVENSATSAALGIAVALAAGLLIGTLNGMITTRGKVNSFISTLAASFMIYGLGYVVSDSSVLRTKGTGMETFARTRILGLPSSSWIAVATVIIIGFVLARTTFGRQVYAVGGNREAARLAGIRVDRVQTITFALGGLTAALAGTLSASRSLSAQPSDDFTFVFAVIAAVVVGGTSITGGEGAVWRSVFGAFFIAFMVNGFNLLGVDPIFQRIIQGAVILAAVLIDARSRAAKT